MEIFVNGQPRPMKADASISDLLRELGVAAKHVAVEVNLELVPREQHAGRQLAPGDRLEIVTLVGGG